MLSAAIFVWRFKGQPSTFFSRFFLFISFFLKKNCNFLCISVVGEVAARNGNKLHLGNCLLLESIPLGDGGGAKM